MYRVFILNGNDKIIINEPTADSRAPHIMSGKYHSILSQPDTFDFTIPINSTGWGKIEGLSTKVKVIDTRDNSILFTGRIMPYKDELTDSGIFDGVYSCEGALGYLNDSLTRRWNYTNKTPQEILNDLLNKHNSKMDTSRQIQLGTVEITTAITIDTNFETTLNTIITKLVNIVGGDIRVQEREGVLYLDYLKALGTDNEVKIQLGQNQKSITREYDPSDVVTRVIPHGYGEGINQLDITNVNNGVEYVEDSNSKYGIIEGQYNNSEIQNADTLLQAAKTALEQNKQPSLTLDTSMVDRSVLVQYAFEKYDLGDTLHIINNVLKIDVYARVVEFQFDILTPQNKDIVISTRPITLTNQIIDLKQRTASIQNAPQGNTCIFALTKSENADSSHPITFDLDIPQEAININKVYINLHGRKYRAYEKGLSAAAEQTGTSGSGGGSTQTSSSGGSSTQTSSGGGAHQHLIGANTGDDTVSTSEYDFRCAVANDNSSTGIFALKAVGGSESLYTYGTTDHTHTISIPAHTHVVNIPDHTHTVTIPAHNHDIKYGIFEDTQPKNCKISINETDMNLSYGDGSSDFDQYDIDITSKITTGNNKIVISTDQNGRIEATVYCQVFIQSK